MTFENGIRGGICNVVQKDAKANNKYMKNCEKNVESSFLAYLDANNLYGVPMCEKLPVGEFASVNTEDYTEDIIKKYDENDDYRAVFIVDVDYPKYLPFLPERKKNNNVEKLICTLENKRNYIVHIVALKEALNHGLKKYTEYLNSNKKIG